MVVVPECVGIRGCDLTAEGVDTGGPDLRKELDGRGSGGKDVSGACVLVSELVEGVGRGKPGNGSTAVGGGASGETTGGRGDTWGVMDNGVRCGALGRNDRRLEDDPVV